MTAVDQSYRYCVRVARSRAKNFYYSFVLLSAQQRKAMCAIYAFMRYCDDLSDEPGASRAPIDRWRAELDDALQGRFSAHPVWPAFHHTVRRFGIPHEYFHQMIEGVTGDLQPRLHHRVRQTPSLRADQPTHRLIETLPGLREHPPLAHRRVR